MLVWLEALNYQSHSKQMSTWDSINVDMLRLWLTPLCTASISAYYQENRRTNPVGNLSNIEVILDYMINVFKNTILHFLQLDWGQNRPNCIWKVQPEWPNWTSFQLAANPNWTGLAIGWLKIQNLTVSNWQISYQLENSGQFVILANWQL